MPADAWRAAQECELRHPHPARRCPSSADSHYVHPSRKPLLVSHQHPTDIRFASLPAGLKPSWAWLIPYEGSDMLDRRDTLPQPLQARQRQVSVVESGPRSCEELGWRSCVIWSSRTAWRKGQISSKMTKMRHSTFPP